MALVLTGEGFSVSSFADAETALEAFTQQVPSLILLDQMLPGMTGLQLLARLLSQGLAAPVVMVTALQDPSFERSAMAAGAVGVLGKPFDVDHLLDLVLQQLSQVN